MIKFIIGILWFFLTIGVLVNLWSEGKQETLIKILWTVGILFFPVLGPIIYIVMASRKS